MAAFAVVTTLAFGAAAFAIARALRRSREVTAAWVMLSVFGNVGNFGLALITFRLGDAALAPATIYFVVILLTSFVVCVGVAAWTRHGGHAAVASVFTTPAVVVAVPALAVSAWHLHVPLMVQRTVGLLGGAMIPTMLFALGVQLAGAKALRADRDVAIVAMLRLVGAPALAWALAGPFRLSGLERAAGILQAGMPAAILVAIIAAEYEIVPGFVTTAVLLSTVASLPTLTVLLALV
jgi:predicted permease